MSVNRTTIKRSAGMATFSTGKFYPERDINIKYAPDFDDVIGWALGRVDECKKDFKIPVEMMLWGGIHNLGVIFPSAVTTPVPGTSLCADTALAVTGKNGDKVQFHNAFIESIPSLYLGVDKNFFAAVIRFMCLIQSGKNPEDADAYFTRSSGATADVSGFDKANFIRQRYSLAWGERIADFEMREGVQVAFKQDTQYDYSANYGTDNAYLGEKGVIIEAKGIPAQLVEDIEAQAAGQGMGLGALGSSASADLVITGGTSHAITLKNAFMPEYAECFDIKKLRAQEAVWRSTTGLTAGVASAVGVVS